MSSLWMDIATLLRLCLRTLVSQVLSPHPPAQTLPYSAVSVSLASPSIARQQQQWSVILRLKSALDGCVVEHAVRYAGELVIVYGGDLRK